jgi:hypothetical protein
MTFEEWWKEYSNYLVLYSFHGTVSFPEAVAKAAWQTAQAQLNPDWNTAPEWANYLAMDSDGVYYWYEDCPKIDPYCEQWIGSIGNVKAVNPIVDWKNSLEKRP